MNIIFDIDGTLWDTTSWVAKAWQKAADEKVPESGLITGEILKGQFGKPMDVIARNLFPHVTDPDELDSIMDICCIYESDILESLTEENVDSIVFDGVRDTLKELSEKHSLYIVSNCQIGYIELFMRKTGTTDLFRDHLCFGQTLTDKGTTILTLMERNGMRKEDTVYVGDTLGDLESTRKAGLPFIFAAYGFGESIDPDYTVNEFRELISLPIL